MRSITRAAIVLAALAATAAMPASAMAKADWDPPASPEEAGAVWPGCLTYKVRHNDYYDIRNRPLFAPQDFYVTGTVTTRTWWGCSVSPPWWFNGESSWEHGIEVYCPVGVDSVTVGKSPSISLSGGQRRKIKLAGHKYTPWADQTFRYTAIKVSVSNCAGGFSIKPYTTMRVVAPSYSDAITSWSRTYTIWL